MVRSDIGFISVHKIDVYIHLFCIVIMLKFSNWMGKQ